MRRVLIPYETGQSWDSMGEATELDRVVLIPYETGQSWDAGVVDLPSLSKAS